jgi:hypothetical protein
VTVVADPGNTVFDYNQSNNLSTSKAACS